MTSHNWLLFKNYLNLNIDSGKQGVYNRSVEIFRQAKRRKL